jgi:hypothetical protein
MITGAIISGGLGLLGSRSQARAAQQAAQASADAQLEAARIAAEEARFRPVGITTRFGTSQFGFDPQGRLSSAGYTVAPELAAIQDRLLSQAGGQQGIGATEQALAAQQGLFNLGQQYLAESPEAAAQSWMQRQQAALAPARERALNQVQQSLFNRGRSGLAVGQGAGMQAANPEMAAYYNALAQQDLDLAAQAQQQGRAQTEFGAGLFGLGAKTATAGYSPLQTQLGLGETIEKLGQSPLDIGAQLGGRSATAGATAGQALLRGGLGAAEVLGEANALSPMGSTLMGLSRNQQLTSGIGNWLSGRSSGTFSDVGGLGQASNDVLRQWGIQ